MSIVAPQAYALGLLLLICAASNGDEFDSLLAKIPSAANAIVLIDVENTLDTPLASKDGWAKKARD